jgi:hypothetical protein
MGVFVSLHVDLPRPPWGEEPAQHHAKLVPILLQGHLLSAKDPGSVVWDAFVDNFDLPGSLRFQGEGSIFPVRNANRHHIGDSWVKGQSSQYKAPMTNELRDLLKREAEVRQLAWKANVTSQTWSAHVDSVYLGDAVLAELNHLHERTERLDHARNLHLLNTFHGQAPPDGPLSITAGPVAPLLERQCAPGPPPDPRQSASYNARLRAIATAMGDSAATEPSGSAPDPALGSWENSPTVASSWMTLSCELPPL